MNFVVVAFSCYDCYANLIVWTRVPKWATHSPWTALGVVSMAMGSNCCYLCGGWCYVWPHLVQYLLPCGAASSSPHHSVTCSFQLWVVEFGGGLHRVRLQVFWNAFLPSCFSAPLPPKPALFIWSHRPVAGRQLVWMLYSFFLKWSRRNRGHGMKRRKQAPCTCFLLILVYTCISVAVCTTCACLCSL